MFGLKIRELRKRGRKTQDDIADALDVHKTTVSRWERTGDVPVERLEDLANALGVTLDELEALRGKSGGDTTTAPESPDYVHSSESLVLWWRAVGRAKHPDPMTRLLLLTLPTLIDESAWIVLTTVEQLIETTHMQDEAERIRKVWPRVVESPWVERVGQVEWVFRLRFGETQNPPLSEQGRV